jgi:predicted RND superfamily exporter protein
MSLASFSVRRPRLVVLAFAVLTAVAAVGALRLREEEDLLVFLPTDDADVQLFKDVSRRFGSLRVALLGVEAPAGPPYENGVFAADVVRRLQAATDAIRNVRGVDRVVSLTSVSDVVASPAGAEVTNLVTTVPADAAAERALRAKVLSRDHIAGNIVSRDGRAALIMVFLADGVGDRQVSEAVRQVAEAKLRPLAIYYGGGPYAGSAIYQEAQDDVWRLSPIALLVLLLVVVLSFRDLVGVVLTVVSVAFSALVVLGAMGWLGDKFTVATSTLPVILFASGSSYAVHVLGRYYLVREEGQKPLDAIAAAIRIVGPPLAIAAGTTAVGFYAMIVSDVRPLRAFGIACGSGVILCWLTSLTLVPAVIALFPREKISQAPQLASLGQALVRLWHGSMRRRTAVIAGALVLGAVCVVPMMRVAVRMEPRAFFRPGSEPWLAERFLDERFGGAHFVQVALHGDFDDPATLRELARLEEFTRSLDGVSGINAITTPLRIIDDVMGGGLRLPATREQAANLYFFLEGEAGMRAMLTPDRDGALLNVRVHGEARAIVEALEHWVARDLRRRPAWPTPDDVAERVAWFARGALHGGQPDLARLKRTCAVLAAPGELDPEWKQARSRIVRAYFSSDEAPPYAEADRARLTGFAEENAFDLERQMKQAAPSPEEGGLAYADLHRRIEDERRRVAVERAVVPVMEAAGLAGTSGTDPALRRQIEPIIDDLFLPRTPPAARVELSGSVAGEPILDRGFSRSVERNQNRALAVAVVVVLVLMYGLFRSVALALLCLWSSLLTLAVLFGVMGVLGLNIDLGTSLVAGIATGAGSDFAMHYLWYLRTQRADDVSRSVGPVMVVSVLLVSLGFIVLALGRSPVMHLFGTLAGLAMSLAAFFTCLLVPAVLNKVGPRMESLSPPSNDAAAVSAAEQKR